LGDLNERRNMGRQIRKVDAGSGPSNAHRALQGESILNGFAVLVGMEQDIWVDPETVLTDLLTDLMHWCDVPNAQGSGPASVDFEVAMQRARRHYDVERLGTKS
jgi:hypothetical protein